MSNALAIAGVTCVLRTLLHDVYNGAALGTVKVSAVAPDIVQGSLGTASDAPGQVNLFLHQVTLNAAYRNVGLPSLGADGGTRLKNPPMALDLHYLLTAYGSSDGQAEALLGYAILMLFQNPVLTRGQVRSILGTLPATDPVSTSGLADQFELLNITPTTLGREEMAWIWTALKADYRPTFPFQVSVVLIQTPNLTLSALPVLSRCIVARPSTLPPLPTITGVAPPDGQPAACLGDTVTVSGGNLLGATGVVLSNARLGLRQALTGPSNVVDSSFQFAVPNPSLPSPQPDPTDIPAGVYLLSAQVKVGTNVLGTNGLPLAIAPRITSWPPGPIASGPSVVVAITCAPYLRTGQQVSLLIGGQEAPADPYTSPTNSPTFTFRPLQPTGPAVPVWLRVDGIDSPMIDMTQTPPVYSGPTLQVT